MAEEKATVAMAEGEGNGGASANFGTLTMYYAKSSGF
jgi:hypothetical protein